MSERTVADAMAAFLGKSEGTLDERVEKRVYEAVARLQALVRMRKAKKLYGKLLFEKYKEEETARLEEEKAKLDRTLKFLDEIEQKEDEQAERYLQHSVSFVSSMIKSPPKTEPTLRPLKSMPNMPYN